MSRAAIEWLGYEHPGLQVGFHYEGASDRVDFYWRRLRTIGESDGWGKYDADDPEAVMAHFVDEKRREDRLRRHESGFIRWEWADVIRFERLDERLRQGGLRRVRPVQTSLLQTLGANPRSLPRARRTKGFSSKPGSPTSG